MADLTQLLQLFNPYPGNRYLQVTTKPDEITEALKEILKGVNGELSLAIYDEHDYSLQFPETKIQRIQSLQDPFRAIPREFDMVLFKDIFHLHENKNMILKIAYTALANTAHIIIMEKKGVIDIEAIKITLENYEFRASNSIDVLEGYDLIMAKKMHMWGNGL